MKTRFPFLVESSAGKPLDEQIMRVARHGYDIFLRPIA